MEDHALFEIRLNLPKDFEPLFADIIKWTTVLCIVHVLNKSSGPLPTGWPGVLRLILFASIGFSAYFLVIHKLVRFRFDGFNLSTEDPIGRLRAWIRNRI